jgi:hypothetical protein
MSDVDIAAAAHWDAPRRIKVPAMRQDGPHRLEFVDLLGLRVDWQKEERESQNVDASGKFRPFKTSYFPNNLSRVEWVQPPTITRY